MADVTTIAKAQVTGAALQKIFGEEPSYQYADDHVRVYFEPDRLKNVQARIQTMAASGPSDVRIDWVPMVTPFALKKGAPVVAGLIIAGILIGRMTK